MQTDGLQPGLVKASGWCVQVLRINLQDAIIWTTHDSDRKVWWTFMVQDDWQCCALTASTGKTWKPQLVQLWWYYDTWFIDAWVTCISRNNAQQVTKATLATVFRWFCLEAYKLSYLFQLWLEYDTWPIANMTTMPGCRQLAYGQDLTTHQAAAWKSYRQIVSTLLRWQKTVFKLMC